LHVLEALLLLVCVGAGTVGGVFFGFSSFIMKALAQLPPRQGVAAMQRINVVVLNPPFLGVFMGTAVLGAACAIAAFVPWSPPRSPWLLAAAVLYVAGTFFVTMAFNVPRNQRLASLDAESSEAAVYWPVYVQQWSMWNHVRTAASLVAAACAGIALAS